VIYCDSIDDLTSISVIFIDNQNVPIGMGMVGVLGSILKKLMYNKFLSVHRLQREEKSTKCLLKRGRLYRGCRQLRGMKCQVLG